MGAVLCIVAKVWWGWYLILGLLIRGVLPGKKMDPSLKRRFPRTYLFCQVVSAIFGILMIMYVLFNKSYFSQSLLKWGQ